MATSQRYIQSALTFSQAALPARTLVTLGFELGWLECEANSPSNLLGFLNDWAAVGWSGRMSPAYYQPMEDALSDSFSPYWQNSGITLPTGCLTLSTSEFHSAAAAS